ncbi:hypothetical protein [Halalkalicoccus salilacus]|uniref:hypothetical protein n=1 Tax=Halalkalicoccus salilacus TaxID=3117459 RepID=UPI00300E9C42
MKRRTLIASIGAVAGTTLGAAAYSSATVTRDATIGVETDQLGLIQLTPSADFTQITEDGTSGALTINFSKLNVGSEFVFGDATAPETTHAFSFVQNDSARDFTFEYGLTNGDPSGDTNVQFEIFGDDGTGSIISQGTVIEGGSTNGATVSTTVGTTYYVVLTINTTGVDQSTSLDGTLTISA